MENLGFGKQFDLEDALDDMTAEEVEDLELSVSDRASAAQTIQELEIEIKTLSEIEIFAKEVCQSKTDKKWDALSRTIQDRQFMYDSDGKRRKLVIFTEHRDTLEYLTRQIRDLIASPESVVTIHGGMLREDRLRSQEMFRQDKEVCVLIATDAAGEGINLQVAHLMVNYDLPWNPNRLEQRFGRIHRIGQENVCRLWNLLAEQTREGAVYQSLLRKLEVEKKALGGKVFDVLGAAISGADLRNLMLEAIRKGDLPEVKARLRQKIDSCLDTARLKELIEQESLAKETLKPFELERIRIAMDRAEAKKLQPHFVSSFFLESFRKLGGIINPRGERRFEVTFVPPRVREIDRIAGRGAVVLRRYERVAFDREALDSVGSGKVDLICPGHPLFDATLDLTRERLASTLCQGAVLVDESDEGVEPRVLVFLEQSIQDGVMTPSGTAREISRRFQFVEISRDGTVCNAGHAPYLDYRPAEEHEREQIASLLEEPWLRDRIEKRATEYASSALVKEHIEEVKPARIELIQKTKRAVEKRLRVEIAHWDSQAEKFKEQARAGKKNAELNARKARERVQELEVRLERRIAELERESHIAPQIPIVSAGAFVVPSGLLKVLTGAASEEEQDTIARDVRVTEEISMRAVMEMEARLGNHPSDVSGAKCGWDIESLDGKSGRLRLIEVKGRLPNGQDFLATRNEILAALNKSAGYILALVSVSDHTDPRTDIRYIEAPFTGVEVPEGATKIGFTWKGFWDRGVNPNDSATKKEAH